MDLWTATLRPGEKATFVGTYDNTLDLTHVVLISGKKASVKFTLCHEETPSFCLCKLTESQPNYLVKLQFEENVKFFVEGTKDTSVSLVGNCKAAMMSENMDYIEESQSVDEPNKSKQVCKGISSEEGKAQTMNKKKIDPNKNALIVLPNVIEKKQSFASQLNTTHNTIDSNIEKKKEKRPLQITTDTVLPPKPSKKKVCVEKNSITTTTKPSALLNQNNMRVVPGGVKYEVLKTGTGSIANIGRRIKVKYEGRLARSGKKFDSGVLDFTIGSGDMIKGFDLGVRGMLLQERRMIFIPSRLGYGNTSLGMIPANSDLMFEVTLLSMR